MKTIYNGIVVEFDREFIEGSRIKWYGSAWANPAALICEGGETITEMCENLTNRIKAYNNGEVIWQSKCL